jgi:hypothetical protein
MPQTTFDEVLDAIEDLPTDQQAELLEVVRRRLAEHERRQVIQDVKDARSELAAGTVKASSVDDIMREIES